MGRQLKKRRRWKVVRWLAIAAVAWFVYAGAVIWRFGGEDHARPSDCIIVLGAAVDGRNPSPVFEERIRHGIRLHQSGKAPLLIFTGGLGDGASHTESEVAMAFAVRNGVTRSAILIETQSRTTQQNLVEANAVMEGAGLRTAILVSDPLHLKRASMMAEDLGMDVVSSPTSTTRYRSLRTKLGFLLREIYFCHHYVLTGN